MEVPLRVGQQGIIAGKATTCGWSAPNGNDGNGCDILVSPVIFRDGEISIFVIDAPFTYLRINKTVARSLAAALIHYADEWDKEEQS